jgi:hypothetical protein
MNWVELLLPVTDFLRLVTPCFKQDQRERAAERMRLIAAVAAAAEKFGACDSAPPPGHHRLMESLTALDRCAVAIERYSQPLQLEHSSIGSMLAFVTLPTAACQGHALDQKA